MVNGGYWLDSTIAPIKSLLKEYIEGDMVDHLHMSILEHFIREVGGRGEGGRDDGTSKVVS